MIREQVKEFHEAMDLPVGDKPRIPSDDRVRLRLELIAEEFLETLQSCLKDSDSNIKFLKQFISNHMIKEMEIEVDLVKFVDGLADIDYVNEGARLEFGVNGGPIAEEVQAANMRKVGGPVREDGKRLKPPGWVGPNIYQRLKDQGWEG